MKSILNLFKDIKTRVWAVGATVVIVVVLAGLAGSSARAGDPAVDANQAEVVFVDVAQTIEASGSLEAQPFASLAWKTGGVVENVYVKPGDVVKKGDVLVSLDASTTSASIASAQADLVAAELDLAAVTSPDGSSVGAAREEVASAFGGWDDARVELMDQIVYNKYSGDEESYENLLSARDDLVNALEEFPLAARDDVQFYYWAARSSALGYEGNFDFDELEAELKRTLSDEDAAAVAEILTYQDEFEKYARDFAYSMDDQSDAVEVLEALGAYEKSADEVLDSIENYYEVAVAPSQNTLISAQANVDAARASADGLRIVAPFDGRILSVDDDAGDTVSAGDLSVNMANMEHLYVNVQVDESDVVNVQMENQAEVTLDALPDVVFQGVVTAINPVGQADSGLVKYSVRVDLDDQAGIAFIPLGGTADVVIYLQDASATLAVPILAIQNDSQGEYVMVVEADGSLRRVDVRGGAIIGDMVAVSGELQAGDVVSTVRESSFEAPNPFGGGNDSN